MNSLTLNCWIEWDLNTVTTRQRSSGKVMFSVVSVCQSLILSVCLFIGGIPVQSACPPRTGPCPQPPSLPDIFKLVHYVARIVGRRAVGIRSKCLLVDNEFCDPVFKLDSLQVAWYKCRGVFLDYRVYLASLARNQEGGKVRKGNIMQPAETLSQVVFTQIFPVSTSWILLLR